MIGLGALTGALFSQRQREPEHVHYENLMPATSTQTSLHSLEYLAATQTIESRLSDGEILQRIYSQDTSVKERKGLYEQLSPEAKQKFDDDANEEMKKIMERFERLRDERLNPEKYWNVPPSVAKELRKEWQALRDGNFFNDRNILEIIAELERQGNLADKKTLYDDIIDYDYGEEKAQERARMYTSSYDELLLNLAASEKDESHRQRVYERLNQVVAQAFEDDALHGTDKVGSLWTHITANRDQTIDYSSEAYRQLANDGMRRLRESINDWPALGREEMIQINDSIERHQEAYDRCMREGDIAGAQEEGSLKAFLHERKARIGTPEWRQEETRLIDYRIQAIEKTLQ